MRISFPVILLLFSITGFAQEERDTILKRCPVFITDTTSSNNFFLEARPCTLRVYRVKGDITIVVEQREQFFSLFFQVKNLKNGKYKIQTNPNSKSELAVKYSFRSGDQVSYVDVSSGTVDVSYDKEKEFWKLKLSGMIANMVERKITFYRVRSELSLK